ncbi:MAG: hypothetical protein IPI41_10100 [Flavobacteriales bacterium]|nr:hypothetical protein [Flavobacteriales bacterium]
MNVIAHSLLIDGSFRLDDRELLRSSGTMEDMFRACYKAMAMDYPKFHKMDAPSKLAVLVTEPLLQRARQEGADLENRAGLLGISHCGSTVTDQEHWDIRRGTGLASPAVFVYTLPNIGLGEITIRHRIFGSSLCLLDHEPKTELVLRSIRVLHERDRMEWIVCLWSDIFADRYDARAVLLGPGPGAPADANTLRTLIST